MPVGFEVINDNGIYQITSDYRNLQFSAKGTATLSGPIYEDGGSIPTYKSVFTRTNTSLPFMAFRSANLVGIFESVIGTTATYTFYSPSPGSVDWWLFDFVPPSPSNFGLQIFKANGDLAYDSNFPILKLAGISQMPGGLGVLPSNLTSTYPSGKTYAGIHSTSGHLTSFFEFTSSPVVYQIDEIIAMSRWSGTQLIAETSTSTTYSRIFSDDMPTNQYINRHPAILVVDVSNL